MMTTSAQESIEFSFNNQRFTLPVIEGTQGEKAKILYTPLWVINSAT
jgi:hypothetical protein